MSTENKETSHLNEEGFSKGEYHDDLDEQKLEAVTGGGDPSILDLYLEHQQKLVNKDALQDALRSKSAPPRPRPTKVYVNEYSRVRRPK